MKTDQTKIEHLFRRQYGTVLGKLIAKFGGGNLEIIEDAVQEALYKAMKLWPFENWPNNPEGWLFRVASNYILDQFKKKGFRYEELDTQKAEDELQNEEIDEKLKMLFYCCHPDVNETGRIVLALNLVAGFGKAEISRALLKSEDAVAKILTRTKKTIQKQFKSDEFLTISLFQSRINDLLKSLYLIFNEGYAVTSGNEIIKEDTCEEAIFLTHLLSDLEKNNAEVVSLLGLMYFQASRLKSRVEKETPIMLEFQDRTKWNQQFIAFGNECLQKAFSLEAQGYYQIQCAIASYHANSLNYENTDWESIYYLYTILTSKYYSFVIALNRLIALLKFKGAAEALLELIRLEKSIEEKNKSVLFHLVSASIYRELKNWKIAKMHFSYASNKSMNRLQKIFIENELIKLLMLVRIFPSKNVNSLRLAILTLLKM